MTNAKPTIVLAITLGEIGGAQNFALGFARWLKQQGYAVTLLMGDGVWLEQAAQQAGIPVIRLKHMGRAIRPWRDLKALWELTSVFKTLHPDVVHLNSTKMGALGSLAARCAGIHRVVYRIGGWVFLEPLSPLVKTLYRLIERVSAHWKDTIICVHPQDADVAAREKIHPRESVIAVANGIDMDAFLPNLLLRTEARAKLHLPPETFVFGTVAGFYPPKNLPEYMAVCAQVHTQEPAAHFLIIGDGNERSKIEAERAKHALPSVVHLPGHLDNQASRLLNAFDVFVLPSVKEGMPWALLEAMAAGLPCIATDVGANAWMLQDECGWIVPKNNITELSSVMVQVLRDPTEAQRRGTNARRAVMQRFPLEQTYQGNLRACTQHTKS